MKILQKLANIRQSDEVKSYFMKNDPEGSGFIQYEQFHNLVRQMDPTITEHEIMTVGRYYSQRQGEDKLNIQKLIGIIQEQLRKRNFEGFSKLREDCLHHDKARYG